MTTKLKRLWHRASLRNPNETSKRWLRERTFTDYTEDPNASNGSFDKVTLLKKSLTDAGAHGLICSLTNRLNRQSLLLCWHQTSGKLLEDDRSHRHISPQELCAFASVAVDPTLGNCSARVYCIKVDSSSNSTSVELPRPSYSTRSQESLTTIGEASIQEDLTMNGGHGLIQDGASGHGESPMNGSLKSPVTKPREDRFELYLLVHWALASGDRPCYTAEWAITPVGASVPDWQVWQTFADQLLLDCCPQGTTAMRRTPPNLFGHRNNLVLAAYMTPDDTAPVMVMDVKEQQTGSVGSMAARSMATRQSIFDMPHLEYGSVLPAVTVVLENQMEGVSLTQGSTMALRCSCPSADTWQTTVAPEQCISASYSPQEDTRAAAAMLLFSMDQPCGPWLRDRPTIAILWRIRNDTAHAYMMAAECSRWDALVLDTHLEISLPTANKSPNRHSGPRSDARQTSQRIPLDETAQSQVSLELSWHAEEGIRLQIVMSHNVRAPSRSPSNTSDHQPPKSPGILSRTSSVRYRHGRVLTRLNGTIIRTAVPRDLVAPALFTLRLNNQHRHLTLFSGKMVTLDGTLVSASVEQLMCGQDGTCLLSPGIHSGGMTGFMIFALGRAINGMPLERHPCLIIAWQTSLHSPPRMLVHTMHILPNQADMLVESDMAHRFFNGLERQLIESNDIQRAVKLGDDNDVLNLAVHLSKGTTGEVTGLEVLITSEPVSSTLMADMAAAKTAASIVNNDTDMATSAVSTSSVSESDRHLTLQISEEKNNDDNMATDSVTHAWLAGSTLTPSASPNHTLDHKDDDNTSLNSTIAESTAVPTPTATPGLQSDTVQEICSPLMLPLATTPTEGSVTETQLTLMVANVGTDIRLQFFTAYPLDVVGSGLSNPIIESGEQAIIILQEMVDHPSSDQSTILDGPSTLQQQQQTLDGCMVFVLENSNNFMSSSPIYLVVGWRVAMDTKSGNCMQVSLVQDASQGLPIDDEEWEEFLLKMAQSAFQADQSEQLYYDADDVPVSINAKMTSGAMASLSVRIKSGVEVKQAHPTVTLQKPGTLEQWDMDGCLVSSPLPLDSNMMYSDGGYNTSAGPFSPILSSIHNSYSSSTFLTVNIQHRHTSLLLRPSMVCMVAGSCREAPTDDLFPQTNMKVEIMSTTRPVTCSGLIIMQLCTNDGVAVAGEPFMVIGWDIDQVMEERHFFARVCDNPYDTGDGADTGGGRADGDISMLETDGVGSGKRDQKMLEENWMARTSLLQKMMRGRAHEAGRRVTTRCIIAGNKLPGDNQLAVTAFMSSVGAPRLDVEFGQDG